MPDSQVTSLHFYFPWLVKALVRWALFNAAHRRSKPLGRPWQRFFDAHDPDATVDENLAAYDAIAREHFEHAAFVEFCETHLADLDAVALDFFQSTKARDIVEAKVRALYPAHEVASFTEHFWGLIQFWCRCEADARQEAEEP